MLKITNSRNNIKLRFIDSYKFLSTSFNKLIFFLNKNFEFYNLSEEDFELLIRKEIFPYEYINKLQDTRLPPRESFYSSLTSDTVVIRKRLRACRERLATILCLNLEWMQRSIFKNGRIAISRHIWKFSRCIESYGLDPSYYYTLPGFTWDAMLKHTRINFDCSLTSIWWCLSSVVYAAILVSLVNVPTDTRKPITNICSHTIRRNLLHNVLRC